jgi:putative transposase
LIKGRKRQVVVDTLGLLVRVLVHPANWQDKEGIRHLLRRVPLFARWVALLLDGGYESDALLQWCQDWLGVQAQVVKRPDDAADFVVLPKRWIVERTFAWLGKYRRLSKDYEASPETSEAMIYAAMVHLMVRRLARS